MSSRSRTVAPVFALLMYAAAQESTTPTITTSPTPTTLATFPSTDPTRSTPPGLSIGTSLSQPPHTDLASPTANSQSGSDGSSGSDDSGGLVNYYFIFLAIIFCIVGLLIFMIWRRKRKALRAASYSRQHALAQDVDLWGRPTGQSRYWPGRWMSTNVSREEGLNEAGEAPPPYVPKSSHETGDTHDQALGVASPSVPLQTLGRDQAGFKPPDYTEFTVRRASVASESGEASGSRGSRTDHTERQEYSTSSNAPT